MATRARASGSPFGEKNREAGLQNYLTTAGPVTADNAWSHVYRLLLSMDRRTQLAHVYDASHMQKGSMNRAAQRFTDALLQAWSMAPAALPAHIDILFRHCAVALAATKVGAPTVTAKPVGELGELIREILRAHMTPSDVLVREIEDVAEEFFSLAAKRQNLRGEGFEDILRHLLLNVSQVPASKLLVRTSATDLPGFRKVVAGGKKPKVPKPDIAIVTPGQQTSWIITAKWSLRQDRLDQFGQEFSYYKGNKTQPENVLCQLITNEMDMARLRAVLAPLQGEGGFTFQTVFHVSLDLLRAFHGPGGLLDLEAHVASGRFMSLKDLLDQAKKEFAPAG